MSLLFKFLREHWPLAVVFAVCALAFAVDKLTAHQGTFLMYRFMLVPVEVTASWQDLLSGDFAWHQFRAFSTLLSYAFLHADAEHILLNLLFIWVFGSLVLRELGAAWFFITFILTAITGGIGQVLLDPQSAIPTLGASGALMGLEGIYLGMALRWRLPNPDVWPIATPISQERLMVFAALGILMDLSGILSNAAGIAYGAHLGGVVGGILLGTTLIPRPRHAV
jgi:membrane associated rhomboid family serine protease